MYLHSEHTTVEVGNLQRMFNLCVMGSSVLTAEDTSVVYVIKQDFCFCSGAAKKIKCSPHNTLYFIVIPQLYMYCTVGRQLNTPLSFAVCCRGKIHYFASCVIGIYKRCFLSSCLAGQLEADSHTVLVNCGLLCKATYGGKRK